LENKVSQLNKHVSTKSDVSKHLEREFSALGAQKFASDPENLSAIEENSGDAPALIKVVLKMIKRSPGMPYSVSEIASAAHMTPNHFSTLFRRHQGVSFSQFVRREKIALAKKLLAELSLDIKAIAAQVGYSDTGYFARCFKQETGTTPQKWRDSSAV
jgi:AraC-like DNA-binding protein